jgi:two-component system KDP operon response regulator KdpE
LAEPVDPVLLIDDDPHHAALLRAVMQEEGLAVEVRHDAESGLAAARELRLSLIVLDLDLPDAPSPTAGEHVVLRALRADRITAGIPVVVVSAWTSEVAHEALAGADAIFPKPFRVDALVERLRALAHRRVTRPS